jgi:hypothetical protein
LNGHATTEDKINYVKDSFYEELECVLDKFPKYYVRSLLGDCNANVSREFIFKLVIRNESLHETNNDKGVSCINLAI